MLAEVFLKPPVPNRIALHHLGHPYKEERLPVCSPFWMSTTLVNSLHGVGLQQV